MGAEEPLVGSPVFKTGGDGAPVLVCSIRTRPRQYPDRRGQCRAGPVVEKTPVKGSLAEFHRPQAVE